MSSFKLIPYRLYLSQSTTWMHMLKAEIKIYLLTLLWIVVFIFSYYKLCILALSLILTGLTIRNKKNIFQKHLLQTLVMTVLTTCLSLSVVNSYKQYSQPQQLQDLSYYYKTENPYRYHDIQISNSCKTTKMQLRLALQPSLYFFITVYAIKLVMITTSPEVLVIAAYKSRIINTVFSNELLFTFLLSSHIISNVINKLDKVIQVASLRGNLNLCKSYRRLFMFSFLIFQAFFLETIKESREISQALYTRNLNQENDNFLKIYTERFNINDWLSAITGTLYFIILYIV
uniref:Cobalt transport protein n=1 Tax=Pyropia perforata TaxID=182771 RepID=A0A059XID9_PYRPE|nr:hypothetical protein [Neoporphyra perforata]AIA20642.1 hypothetical protein [Neoporphyra perforata]AIA20851.1 hypothetical protein [Neoporphyra perforata]AIA21060.1 hypothetical protein [Neoporphyra perforata]